MPLDILFLHSDLAEGKLACRIKIQNFFSAILRQFLNNVLSPKPSQEGYYMLPLNATYFWIDFIEQLFEQVKL